MFRPDREPRGEDPFLLVKLAIFVVAAIIAVIGIGAENEWVVFVAIVILAVGFVLGLIGKRAREKARDASSSDDEPTTPPA
jgi:general stress protein CsbA